MSSNAILNLTALVDKQPPPPLTPSPLSLTNRPHSAPLDFDRNHTPYYRLYLSPTDPRPHGFILPDTITRMPWPPSFTIDHTTSSITLSAPPAGTSPASHINTALQTAVDKAIDENLFPVLSSTHSEHFRIPGARTSSSPEKDVSSTHIAQVERFAAPLFGIATRGAHMTAYIRTPPSPDAPNGGLSLWVARRSRHLFTHPGKLDSTVAGGVKSTDSPTACILAEAMEEASLPADLVTSRAVPTGVVTLANRNPKSGLFHGEILYVYDMELPADVVPTPADGEVEEFVLMDVGEVRTRMEAGEFKPNVCAVMADFMIRHGVITPESEGEGAYVEICSRLRRRLPMPTSPEDY